MRPIRGGPKFGNPGQVEGGKFGIVGDVVGAVKSLVPQAVHPHGVDPGHHRELHKAGYKYEGHDRDQRGAERAHYKHSSGAKAVHFPHAGRTTHYAAGKPVGKSFESAQELRGYLAQGGGSFADKSRNSGDSLARGEVHRALATHGYKHVATTADPQEGSDEVNAIHHYEHPSGHEVVHNEMGGFVQHYHAGGQVMEHVGLNSLKRHLQKVHGKGGGNLANALPSQPKPPAMPKVSVPKVPGAPRIPASGKLADKSGRQHDSAPDPRVHETLESLGYKHRPEESEEIRHHPTIGKVTPEQDEWSHKDNYIGRAHVYYHGKGHMAEYNDLSNTVHFHPKSGGPSVAHAAPDHIRKVAPR